MKPSTGKVVLYKLTEADAAIINIRRTDFDSYRAKHAAAGGTEPRRPGEAGATGHIAHVGNDVAKGDEFPAMIVRTWADGSKVNLQVHLDGSDLYWVQARPSGDGPGEWRAFRIKPHLGAIVLLNNVDADYNNGSSLAVGVVVGGHHNGHIDVRVTWHGPSMPPDPGRIDLQTDVEFFGAVDPIEAGRAGHYGAFWPVKAERS